ncbi:NAD-dependent succinate-semialdehyde dehydrogenase [Actinopolyspora erythraea]|uniref:Succinate-semialdehyde dehydrogenase n=1 Tax=Actinopolyspora erythraea TaxID=414996 RepID=A0A099D897_9ACTN|nr:NAD-dependent succinate-semialdehyde dehydrogenase [Actinopolyspora erythraea]ASU81018.1 NAD-dependent succinate-semialdehyde dehydrogenase [Actinopolyspora erythraea]KGI81605.1 succinate-semialdehyde dehydrogenase [Actinopolyspora erythraea]
MNADDQPHHPRESTVVEAVPRALLIDGTWRPATAERTFEVEDPSTTTPLCAVPDATADDALRALDAADRAQSSWADHPPRQRGEILRRAFEIVTSRHEDLSLLMTLEMGKPLAESRAEVTYAAEFFRWFAEEAVRVDGDYTVSPNGAGRVLVMRQPVGPSLMVTPWNFPMAMGTRKIGPAVAAGCTMVLKPAHQTPLTMLALGEILTEAGLPDGVLNIITARDAGAVMGPLISDPRARKLTFTGSTAVGRTLIEQSAEQVLKVSMELGGNAPFLVFDDADVDAAVDGAMLAKMRNIGEACTAANRFYLHRDIADEFTDKLTRRMRALRVGRGVGDDVEVGPLIDAAQLNKVTELVDDAVQRGARVLTGGKADSGPGYYYQPTVLTDVPATARLTGEEVFGPVAPISTFTDEDEALTAANNTEFGLVSYAYTQNMRRALRVSEALQTGMVGLNQGVVSNAAAPFGGVKQSGIGREGGKIGIDEYLETKYVAVGGP